MGVSYVELALLAKRCWYHAGYPGGIGVVAELVKQKAAFSLKLWHAEVSSAETCLLKRFILVYKVRYHSGFVV
ncbi:MAG: hypothetical protein ACKESB_00210, partial [Candidatus Hodgkinia cicadicola]